MILRLEVKGHVLHIEWTRPAPAQPGQAAPDNVPQPIQVIPEDPADPVSARLGFQQTEDRHGAA